ncbi:tRNA (adenosine(37)-N6)-threonylcarbamoyltransferase complex ATPase subunit type 1 TsaE [Gemmatimonadales bacterium]|nr:tRNA (adenosine(37)-N6)-threonylcarbamoyltransferase complex ATPase subunit type 1 TsaE [Gemmatimonadales bacterium]
MRLNERELERWGERIGNTIGIPAVIALEGRLGAGKSVLARAIGRGAGVGVAMPSPSYNLLLRYRTPSGREVVHVDLYRLRSSDELWELGWSELGEGSEVLMVEWADRASPFMPPDYWIIGLSAPDDDHSVRDVELRCIGRPPELPPFLTSVSIE